jgi:hypothetical protein
MEIQVFCQGLFLSMQKGPDTAIEVVSQAALVL